jgi:hypothetical protein
MRSEYPGKHVAYAHRRRLRRAITAWAGRISLRWPTRAGQVGPFVHRSRPSRGYYDHMVRRDGRWLFARRQIRMAGEPMPEGARASPATLSNERRWGNASGAEQRDLLAHVVAATVPLGTRAD